MLCVIYLEIKVSVVKWKGRKESTKNLQLTFNVNCLDYILTFLTADRNMVIICKGMNCRQAWKQSTASGNKEFDCDRCILVARDFLLFYFKEHLHERK